MSQVEDCIVNDTGGVQDWLFSNFQAIFMLVGQVLNENFRESNTNLASGISGGV